CHGGRDLGAGRLEVLGLAMRIERGLVLVDLHDHVGARILARLEQLVELVYGFVGADLACQGSEYSLELAFLTLLDLQGRNQSNGHQSLLLSAIPTLAPGRQEAQSLEISRPTSTIRKSLLTPLNPVSGRMQGRGDTKRRWPLHIPPGGRT